MTALRRRMLVPLAASGLIVTMVGAFTLPSLIAALCHTIKTKVCPNDFFIKIQNTGDPNGTALVGDSQSITGGVGLQGTTVGTNGVGVLAEDLGGSGLALKANGPAEVDGNEYYLLHSVNATTANGSGAIFGESTGAVGVPIGVIGTCQSDTGRGVFAASNSATGPGIGVYGISYGDNGRGLFGWAFSGTGTNYGVYGQTNSATGYGVYSDGDMHVQGNFTASGSKAGCVIDFVQNADSVALEPGDLVEIVGYGEPVLGDIPLILVRRATSSNAEAVLGPVAYAAEARSHDVPAGKAVPTVENTSETHPAKFSISEISGNVEPGRLAAVVTLGAFKFIKVDASYGSVGPGTLLVSSPTAGYAMRGVRPEIGTVVGKALGSLANGSGMVPVIVQSR